jgi:hypothetical protein
MPRQPGTFIHKGLTNCTHIFLQQEVVGVTYLWWLL